MKFRLLNHLYANIAGYFWLPCPLCGQYFGGHEWKQGNDLKDNFNSARGVCPDCGERAREINRENGFTFIFKKPISNI